MFRYRRYRVFLVFAIVVVIALYKFGGSGTTWREAASTAAELKNEAEDALGFGPKPRPPIAHETKKLELHIPAALTSQALHTPPPVKKVPTIASSAATARQSALRCRLVRAVYYHQTDSLVKAARKVPCPSAFDHPAAFREPKSDTKNTTQIQARRE
jgi:hypothetical protein